MNNSTIQIVIPTFNRKEITIKCINSLLTGTYSDINIIICDSNSTDGTLSQFVSYKKIKTLNVGFDKWWTGAVNAGVAHALEYNPKFILILNDDIDFTDTLVDDLLFKAKQYPNCIISPLQKTKNLDFFGMNYIGINKKPIIISKINTKVYDSFVDTSNGCCLLIPSIVFNFVGYFNESKCPHLAGDTEFQLRAKNNGYKTLATSDIIIIQGKPTDYFSNVKFKNIFSLYSSPVYFNSYWRFGITLFKNSKSFIFLGYKYHYIYFKTIIKILAILFKRMAIRNISIIKCKRKN
jgi:GT2 family glycosyltransferase